jgi:hypothetical protein
MSLRGEKSMELFTCAKSFGDLWFPFGIGALRRAQLLHRALTFSDLRTQQEGAEENSLTRIGRKSI